MYIYIAKDQSETIRIICPFWESLLENVFVNNFSVPDLKTLKFLTQKRTIVTQMALHCHL